MYRLTEDVRNIFLPTRDMLCEAPQKAPAALGRDSWVPGPRTVRRRRWGKDVVRQRRMGLRRHPVSDGGRPNALLRIIVRTYSHLPWLVAVLGVVSSFHMPCLLLALPLTVSEEVPGIRFSFHGSM